jgi:hypothetical protein
VAAPPNAERLHVDYIGEIQEFIPKEGVDMFWEPLTYEITSWEKLKEE